MHAVTEEGAGDFSAEAPWEGSQRFYRRVGKRALDVGLSIVALVLAAPVLLLTALAVAWDSGFPVLYRAPRAGLRGRRIQVLKLRTMSEDAARIGGGLSPAFDPRITRVGGVLRRWKLDELPQFWNVLVGDMSMVGPRPQSPDVAERVEDEPRIFSVRPGLTDWASILLHDEGTLLGGLDETRVVYDRRIRPLKRALMLEYVAHASLRVDLLIIVQTAWVLIESRVLRRHPRVRLWGCPLDYAPVAATELRAGE